MLIADDQGMVRTGLRSLLEGEDDISVVAEASDGVAADRRDPAHVARTSC